YHSLDAQTAVLTRAPSAQTKEARRETRAGGGPCVARLPAQENHRRRSKEGGASVGEGEDGAVAAGRDAEADRDQPGGRQGGERRHVGSDRQSDVLRPDGDRLGPRGPANHRDGAASAGKAAYGWPKARADRGVGRFRLGLD